MPFCPVCAQEYEPGIAACADCGAKLVDKLPEMHTGPGSGSAGLVELLRTRRPELLGMVRKLLQDNEIPVEVGPAQPEEGSSSGGEPETVCVLVPESLWGLAVQLVTPALQAAQAEEENRDADLVPESLKRPLKEIMAEGDAMLADLAKGMLAGDNQIQVKAGYALVKLGEPARRLLLRMLAEAIDGDLPHQVRRLAKLLAELPNPENLQALMASLKNSAHRMAAVTAMGYLHDDAAVPVLVDLLEDPDPEVRNEAAESLYELTDMTFDFDAEASEEERSQSVACWRRFMKRQGHAAKEEDQFGGPMGRDSQ